MSGRIAWSLVISLVCKRPFGEQRVAAKDPRCTSSFPSDCQTRGGTHKACRESVPHLMPAAVLPAAAPQLNTAVGPTTDQLPRAPVAKVTGIKRNNTTCVPEVWLFASCTVKSLPSLRTNSSCRTRAILSMFSVTGSSEGADNPSPPLQMHGAHG